MTSLPAGVRLKPVEAAEFAKLTKRKIASFRWHKDLTPEQYRAANRLLLEEIERLRAAGCRQAAIAKALHISSDRMGKLFNYGVMTEEEAARREAVAEARRQEHEAWAKVRAAKWKADSIKWREENRVWRAQQRAEKKQSEREEAREIGAQNLACLIECLEDMRVGWERDVYDRLTAEKRQMGIWA
jgi:DNA-binding transcriptional MerR regulator